VDLRFRLGLGKPHPVYHDSNTTRSLPRTPRLRCLSVIVPPRAPAASGYSSLTAKFQVQVVRFGASTAIRMTLRCQLRDTP
jgi:hypothetical protein